MGLLAASAKLLKHRLDYRVLGFHKSIEINHTATL
jgi:hypothetical protein